MVDAGLGSLREISDEWSLEELLEGHDYLNRVQEAESMARKHAETQAAARKSERS